MRREVKGGSLARRWCRGRISWPISGPQVPPDGAVAYLKGWTTSAVYSKGVLMRLSLTGKVTARLQPVGAWPKTYQVLFDDDEVQDHDEVDCAEGMRFAIDTPRTAVRSKQNI